MLGLTSWFTSRIPKPHHKFSLAMSRPSLDSHPFTSSGHSNAHATPCSAHAPAAPSPATKPWNGKATDHGAVAPCSAWCATRWRPGQHRTGCCRLALMEKRNGAHGELKASDIPYKVKRATKDEKTVTTFTPLNFCTACLQLLPTVHLDPLSSLSSFRTCTSFGGDLLTSCPSKSISPRPQKTKSIAAKMLPLKKLPKETNLLPPLGVVTELCESLFDPLPVASSLFSWGDGPRTDWLVEDLWRYLQGFTEIELEEVIGADFHSLSWARDSQKYLNLSKGSKEIRKMSSRNWVLTSSEHAIAVEAAVRAPMSDCSKKSPSCHVKRKIWRKNRLWGKTQKYGTQYTFKTSYGESSSLGRYFLECFFSGDDRSW